MATVGVDPRTQRALALFFERSCAGRYRLVPDGEAQVVLVDREDPDASRFLADRAPDDRRPLLLLTHRPSGGPGDEVLVKPVRGADLERALQRLAPRLAEPGAVRAGASLDAPPVRSVGTRPDRPPAIRPDAPADRANDREPTRRPDPALAPSVRVWAREGLSTDPSAAGAAGRAVQHRTRGDRPGAAPWIATSTTARRYDREQHLEHLLRRVVADAGPHDRPTRVSGPWGAVTYVPASGLALVEATDEDLRAASRAPLLPSYTRRRTLRSSVPTPPGAATEPVERLLWRLAIWSARGRLPLGDEPTTVARLRHWPDLARLEPIPHALQIAACWVGRTMEVGAVAERLAIDAPHVHTFFVGADAIGLIERVGDGGAGGVGAAPEPSGAPVRAEDRPVLQRLLRRLRVA